MIKYSVIIPVYRGEFTLKKLTEEILDFFSHEKESFDIIFVDDCAPDKSWAVINSLKKKYDKVIKGIKLSGNVGQHNAIIVGILNATGEYVITMDDDLQQSPHDIIRLINKQRENDYDLVYGRFKELKHNKFRNFASRILRKFLVLGLHKLYPDYSPFRLIKTEYAKKVLTRKNLFSFIDADFSINNFKTGSVEVRHLRRNSNKSSYNLRRLFAHSFLILINYSFLVIKVISWISLIIFLLALSIAIFLLTKNLLNSISFQEVSANFTIYRDLLLLLLLYVGFIYFIGLLVEILKLNKPHFKIIAII